MNEVTGYKINTQKSLAFLYTNSENSETEIRKIIPFTISTQRIKYQNKPTLTDKDMYAENCKSMMKEINDTNRWRCTMILDLKEINIVKITILSKAIPIKLPMVFFTELEEKNSQLVWKHRRP